MTRLASVILTAWILQATANNDVVKTSSLRSAPNASSEIESSRRLSFERIANYAPRSLVTDHNAIDLDQMFMNKELVKETNSGFIKAKEIYIKGGNSKTIARVSLMSPLTVSISEKSDFIGEAENNDEINLTLLKDATSGTSQLLLRYATSEIQEYFNQCRVGALQDNDVVLNGCLRATGEVKLDGASNQVFRYSYPVTTANYNDRTLQSLSTKVESEMLTCPRCPYKDAQYFSDYYGRADYANEYILAAFEGKRTNFEDGNADFSAWGYSGRSEAIKKATAYMSVMMFSLRSFEDALDKCVQDNSIDAVHAWDKGVAYYTGSLEEQTGLLDGVLMHQLADEKCKNFKTCGTSGDNKIEDTSRVNHDMLRLVTEGQSQIDNLACAAAKQTKEAIADLMYIPLVQATLQYAFRVDKEAGGEKEQGAGAAFAASVLPRVFAVDADAAQVIYNNMRVGAPSTDVNLVKEAFESVYRSMNIGCEEVGGLVGPTGEYITGMRPCTASDDGSKGSDNDDKKATDNDDKGGDNDDGKGGDNDDKGGDNDDKGMGGDDDDDKNGGSSSKSVILGSVLGSLSGVLFLGTIGTLMFIRGRNNDEEAVFDANKEAPSIS